MIIGVGGGRWCMALSLPKPQEILVPALGLWLMILFGDAADIAGTQKDISRSK